MSDHIEHKCSWCGSLLHHVEDCPSKLMSDTPRTDKETYQEFYDVFATGGISQTVDADFARTLERENNQLRAELKQCAEAMKELCDYADANDGLSPELRSSTNDALSLPFAQAALKEKQ